MHVEKVTVNDLAVTSLVSSCKLFQLQAFFLVADDMMDGSTTRRGQPCWYKRDDVGMTAINDAIILETCLYTLLHDHFSDQPNYLDTIDAFLYVGIQFFYSLYDQK